MAGTPTQRRETLVAVLLAVVVASSFVAGAVGLGAAHGNGDHVTRNGDQLVVRLGDQHNATKAKQITVSVPGKTLTWPKNPKKNATGTFTVPISKLATQKTNLQNAEVTVTAKNGTTITERENLRMLAFSKKGQASFADDGTLRVPLKTALGYQDDAEVTVALDGKRKAVSGNVRYAGGNASLAVSFDLANLSLPVSKQAKIRVPGRATTTVPLRKLVRQATEIDRSDGKRVVVTSPLLAADSTYSVSIRSRQPSGRFASTVQTNGSGAVVVSDSAMANAQNLTVSAYRSGNRVVRKQVSSSDSTAVYQGKVLEDGSGVELLDGDSLDAQNATVWLTNGSDYAQLDANVTNGGTVLDFGETNYRLHRNGSYNLTLTGETYARIDVSGNRSMSNSPFLTPTDGGDGETGNSSATGVFDDPLGYAGDNPLFVLGGGVLTLLLLGVGFAVLLGRGGGRSGSAQSATAGTTVETHKLDVFVRDGGTNEGLEATVTAEEMGTNGASKSERIDGKGTLTLEHGTWWVTVESNGLSERERVDMSRDDSLRFTLGPQQVTVTVTDDDGEPISNVGVTCATDAGTKKTRKPNEDGERTVNVPLDATEAELSADHEKFEGDETTVTFDDPSVESSLTLRRLTGDLRVSATVDGTPIPGARIEVTPREEAVRQLGEREQRARTDDEGTAAFEDLLVGRYEIGMAIPTGGRAFRTTSKRVEVRDGAVVRESLDASFQYSLDSRDRERIASLRERAESLSSASGRDVAIPRYYGTVVADLLDAVERLPDQGHRFAAVDDEPGEVATALLDAAERTVRLVDDAMTTKRNTDLFGACVDMPDRRVEWTGQFDLDSLFELLEQDRTAQRQTVLEQLRRVDDRIDDERSGLAVVAPAREPWELTREFVNSERGGDLVRGAAVAFAAGGLLDAVDELFDHEELRKRLERTVF